MNKFKSYFKFSRGQRNGIFLLISIIFLLQLLTIILNNVEDENNGHILELSKYQTQIDSLKYLSSINKERIIYPFNPNFITDYKGYTLGMSNEEIDRLLRYRAEDKWINSKEDFQAVTEISDSLLNVISPYFKFPDWVKGNSEIIKKSRKSISQNNYVEKIDLNIATAEELREVNGIGKVLSNRIIEYRSKLDNGFSSMVQLQEIYGLNFELIEKLGARFVIKTPAIIKGVNLNSASSEELVLIKYIDYEIAHNIIEYRSLHGGFKSLDELLEVKGFPAHRIDLIKLYLRL